jgi:hypothetical protein
MGQREIEERLEQLDREELIKLLDEYSEDTIDMKWKSGTFEEDFGDDVVHFAIKPYEETVFDWDGEEDCWWMGWQQHGVPHSIGPVSRESLELLREQIDSVLEEQPSTSQ